MPEPVTDLWVTDICLSSDGSDYRQIVSLTAAPRDDEEPTDYTVEIREIA